MPYLYSFIFAMLLCRNISFELQLNKMVSVLEQNLDECFLPFLHHSTLENKQSEVLKTLDKGGYQTL